MVVPTICFESREEKDSKAVLSLSGEKEVPVLLYVILGKSITCVSFPVQSWVLSVHTFSSVCDTVLAPCASTYPYPLSQHLMMTHRTPSVLLLNPFRSDQFLKTEMEAKGSKEQRAL